MYSGRGINLGSSRAKQDDRSSRQMTAPVRSHRSGRTPSTIQSQASDAMM